MTASASRSILIALGSSVALAGCHHAAPPALAPIAADEYNLALGQRRAAAAKRYLVDHGIVDGRIETISYGEERPACQGHDESCWSQNRRDEFVVTSGSTTASVP